MIHRIRNSRNEIRVSNVNLINKRLLVNCSVLFHQIRYYNIPICCNIFYIAFYFFYIFFLAENIELSSFVIGDTPHVKYVKVFEPSSGTSGLQTASWTPSCKPGPEHQLVLEGDIGLHSEDFKIVFKTRLGSKW